MESIPEELEGSATSPSRLLQTTSVLREVFRSEKVENRQRFASVLFVVVAFYYTCLSGLDFALFTWFAWLRFCGFGTILFAYPKRDFL